MRIRFARSRLLLPLFWLVAIGQVCSFGAPAPASSQHHACDFPESPTNAAPAVASTETQDQRAGASSAAAADGSVGAAEVMELRAVVAQLMSETQQISRQLAQMEAVSDALLYSKGTAAFSRDATGASAGAHVHAAGATGSVVPPSQVSFAIRATMSNHQHVV